MASHHVFNYPRLSDYEFSDLPKGALLTLSMNPYKGYVFLDFEKHESSYQISLDVMRRIVGVCDVLERNGSSDPLRDFVRLSESGVLGDELSKAAKESIKAFTGRSEEDGKAASGSKDVKQAS